ncbi:MAG: hypothetical protein FWB72_06600 [Firmicutes bacterium]|nr:hypothetical protein [Bacillota bacterium]
MIITGRKVKTKKEIYGNFSAQTAPQRVGRYVSQDVDLQPSTLVNASWDDNWDDSWEDVTTQNQPAITQPMLLDLNEDTDTSFQPAHTFTYAKQPVDYSYLERGTIGVRTKTKTEAPQFTRHLPEPSNKDLTKRALLSPTSATMQDERYLRALKGTSGGRLSYFAFNTKSKIVLSLYILGVVLAALIITFNALSLTASATYISDLSNQHAYYLMELQSLREANMALQNSDLIYYRATSELGMIPSGQAVTGAPANPQPIVPEATPPTNQNTFERFAEWLSNLFRF